MQRIVGVVLCAAAMAASTASVFGAETAASKKQALMLEEARHRLMWVAPKHPGFLRAPLGIRAGEQWRSGVIDSGLAPLPGAVYDIKNQYQNVISDRHVSVFAGVLRDDPRQGVIVVLNQGLDATLASSPQVYRIGNHQGGLEIVAAQGGLLRLRSASGALFTFPIVRALSPMRRF